MFAASKTDSVSGSAPDAQFNYVTMLLHGDGTNGAQNNTFLDSSTNAFSITRNGNTTQGSFSPYGSNWSNYLNGTTDYLSAPASANLSCNADFTLEFWLYSTNNNTGTYCIYVANPNASSYFGIKNGQYCYQANSGGEKLWTGGVVALNTWNHIALVRSGSTVTVYQNGTAVTGTATDSNTFLQSAQIVNIGSLNNSLFAFGYISNLRLVKGTAVYTSSFTPSTTPLTAITNTQLLTCQSNRFVDNSTNAFAITVNGTPSVQRFNPFGTATAYSTSVIGGSGYFDGSGDNLTAPDSSAFDYGSGDFTLECWIYPTTTNSSVLLTSQTNGGNFGPCNLFFSSGALQLYSSSNNSSFDVASGASVGTPIVNQWSHVAVSRSGTSIRCFLNGTLTSTTTSSATLMDATGTFQIASRNGGEFYSGYISNFRVVKGTAVYTAAFTPPTSPLTAISGTSLLTNMTNGAIFDNAMMNDLETVGNAQISTSVKKYGTGSMYFDGTGDNLTTASAPSVWLGSGAFTLEMWLYPNDASSQQILLSGSNTGSIFLGMNIDGSNRIALGRTGVAVDNFVSYTYVTSAWIHLAITRDSSNNVRFFVDGTQVGSTGTNSNSFTNSALNIGFEPTQKYLNGYIDDLRITNGYARYTANFTPPTAALSDTGPI